MKTNDNKEPNDKIAKKITAKLVADGLFGDSSNIEKLTIPDAVEEIDRGAFAKCAKLNDVILHCRLKRCGACIFGTKPKLHFYIMSGADCGLLNNDNAYLRETQISGNGEKVGEGMFHHCEHLWKAVIDDGITAIGSGAFDCCYELREISIPETVERIGNMAFAYCISLNGIKLPSGLKKIERSTFLRCTDLERIEIPDSVTEIEESAFLGCSSLKEVVLSKNLEKIGNDAFGECDNLKLIIPDTVGYNGKRVIGE